MFFYVDYLPNSISLVRLLRLIPSETVNSYSFPTMVSVLLFLQVIQSFHHQSRARMLKDKIHWEMFHSSVHTLGGDETQGEE